MAILSNERDGRVLKKADVEELESPGLDGVAKSFQTQLVVETGGRVDRVSVGSACFLVGRDASCHLQIDSPTVSRRHCVIVLNTSETSIFDLGSRNGTFVNGRRLNLGESVDLAEGVQLRIGHVWFSVQRDASSVRFEQETEFGKELQFLSCDSSVLELPRHVNELTST